MDPNPDYRILTLADENQAALRQRSSAAAAEHYGQFLGLPVGLAWVEALDGL
jgi:hypothetical protein